jgi:hypothetical protein
MRGDNELVVFTRGQQKWTRQARLAVPDAVLFGWDHALDGDTLAVGARNAVHVFVRSGEVWNLRDSLSFADELHAGSLALSKDTLVVGAGTVDGHRGAAYVFVRSSSTWRQQTTLRPIDETDWLFGSAVAVDRDTILIGVADGDQRDLPCSGTAVVFVRRGETWEPQSQLIGSDTKSCTRLDSALAVALAGDVAVIGVPWVKAAGHHAGAAYVFERRGNEWSQMAELMAPERKSDAWFGDSVAVFGDRILIGAPATTADHLEPPSVYLFTRRDGLWSGATRFAFDTGIAGLDVALADDLIATAGWRSTVVLDPRLSRRVE